jgi:DNA transformation protein
MKDMPAPDSFTAHLLEQLAPLGVRAKRLFGSVGLFRDGLLIGLVHDDSLYLRADDGNRALFGAAPRPFRYTRQGKPAELPYWRAPDALLDDPDELLAWGRAAFAAARRAAAARLRKKPRRAPPPA